jgi:hypothetical protein
VSDLLPLPLRVAHASAKLQIKIKRIAAIFRPQIETYLPACLIIVSAPPYHRQTTIPSMLQDDDVTRIVTKSGVGSPEKNGGDRRSAGAVRSSHARAETWDLISKIVNCRTLLALPSFTAGQVML